MTPPRYSGLILTTHRDGGTAQCDFELMQVIEPGPPLEYSEGVPSRYAAPLDQTTLEHKRLTFHHRGGKAESINFWAPPEWSQPDIVRHLAARYVKSTGDDVAWTAQLAEVRGQLRCAENLLSRVEALFPGWQGFRDLVDCIEVTLHRLRNP